MPAAAQPTHHVHPGDLPYAQPVLRAPSPVGSINTEYGPDETSQADLALSAEEFQRKIEADIHIHDKSEQEMWSDALPLKYPAVKPGSPEEKAMFDHTMIMLRRRIDELEDNEIVENMMLKGSQVSFDPPPSSDIDAIMQSMMLPPNHAQEPLSAMSIDDVGFQGSAHWQDSQRNGFGEASGVYHAGKGKGRAA